MTRNNPYLIEMGLKVKAKREAKKITLRAMGKLCDMDFTHLCRLENGTQDVRLLTLKLIADVLEVDVKDFL
jgi:transcriptional regulator with XRE-family HTH domain